MSSRWRSLLLCLALWPALSAAAPDPAAGKALHSLFDSDWERQLKESPVSASFLGDPRYNDRWADLSPAAIEASKQAVRDSRAKLLAIDRATLSEADQLNYDIYLRQLDDQIAGFVFPTEVMPVSHQGGVHSIADSLMQGLRFEGNKDYADWIARLRAYGVYMDQNIALMRQGMASGWTPPKAIMVRVPAQIAAQIVARPEDSSYYAPFVTMSAKVSAADQAKLRAQASAAISETVMPALQRFQVFLQRRVSARLPQFRCCRRPAQRQGLLRLPRALLHHHRHGCRADPRDRPEGSRADSRRDGENPRGSRLQGRPAGFLHLPAQRSEIPLQQRRATAHRVPRHGQAHRSGIDAAVRDLPRAPYGVVPIPDKLAPDVTTAYYNAGSVDGRRAGTYYVNLYKPETRLIWEMLPLTIHEAVPGHHLQISIANELPDQPMFRRQGSFTAFVEGWALYAEQLGYDMNLYSDPYDRMGQLSYEMWRAVRLVIDTGLHSQGLSRQEAIDYFRANAPKSDNDITNEVDRYLGTPGQALAYKLGQMDISRLRAKARDRLGDRFDLRTFHDQVLGAGALPLSVLDARMDQWIDAQASARP